MGILELTLYNIAGILHLIVKACKTSEGLMRVLSVLLIIAGILLLYYTITTIIYMNAVMAQGI